MESVVDWSGILPELLVEIAIRIRLVEDFNAFRGVCTSWRAAVSKDKYGGVNKFRQGVPLLMLAEKTENGSSDEREFYSLLERKISLRLPLPEAKGKKCIEVKFGWLLTSSSSGEATLFNPWSRAVIELPNFKTFPEYYKYEPAIEYSFIERAVLSANPSDPDTSDSFMLMVIACQFMGFWSPGDKNWTRLESKISLYNMNITYYNHKWYAINHWGKLWTCDPATGTDEYILTVPALELRREDLTAYLVVSSDGLDLLLITRGGIGDGVSNFQVIGIDVMNLECKHLAGLPNEDTIFVGDNASISVSTCDGIEPNCIYFTDDNFETYNFTKGSKGGGKDMGVYIIADGSIERFEVTSPLSFVCTSLWISPSSQITPSSP